MAPRLVDVIRSCSSPSSVPSVGKLVTDSGSGHPSVVMGRHFASRLRETEYVINEQERVGAGRITEPLGHRQCRGGRRRKRAAGGSFICPNTMQVCSMTERSVLPILVSCISSQRSFPSRVRSPTPAKTE